MIHEETIFALNLSLNQIRLQICYGSDWNQATQYLDKMNHYKTSFPALSCYYHKSFLYSLKMLKLELENKAAANNDTQSNNATTTQNISGFHGANSGILIGLMKTATTLYPTGVLTKLKIVPLSGELSNGAAQTGVNNHSLSFSLPNREQFECSLSNYANKYHRSDANALFSILNKCDLSEQIEPLHYAQDIPFFWLPIGTFLRDDL